MANPNISSIMQADGTLKCGRCGGTQFNARHSTTRKLMVGVGTLIGSANEVHCLACGAKYARRLDGPESVDAKRGPAFDEVTRAWQAFIEEDWEGTSACGQGS